MSIKRIAILASAILLALTLAGCKFLDYLSDLRTSILQKGGETIENVTKKAEEVGEQIKKTKDAVEQKFEDVQDAVKEVKEAVDAVKKVTGEDKNTNSGTGTAR